MKNFYLIFGVIVIVIAIVLAVFGYWPVAFADKQPIFFNEFNRDYDIAVKFYEANLKSTGQDTALLKNDGVKAELRRAVLESLIINKLIDEELQNRIGSGDLKRMIEEKISKADLSGEEVEKGIELLYGLSVKNFKNLVLVSKAKEEILDGNLIVKGGNLSQWMEDKKKEVKVAIFIPKMQWENGVRAK